ncbi:hypothetical protein FACS1894217_00060 [Clostridia bacterium]|nr:hypothetical protein FACS1894217_00060 [Clostridia bacterium]
MNTTTKKRRSLSFQLLGSSSLLAVIFLAVFAVIFNSAMDSLLTSSENRAITSKAHSAERALKTAMSTSDNAVLSLSSAGDAMDFMLGENPEFIWRNWPHRTISEIYGFTLTAFITRDGKFIYLDNNSDIPADYLSATAHRVLENYSLYESYGLSGIDFIGGSPFYITAMPVAARSKTITPPGVMIAAVALDGESLSSLTGYQARIVEGVIYSEAYPLTHGDTIETGLDMSELTLDENGAALFVTDLRNLQKSVAPIKIIVILIALGFIAIVIVGSYLIMSKAVLAPVLDLSASVSQISRAKKATADIHRGSREMYALSIAINDMAARLRDDNILLRRLAQQDLMSKISQDLLFGGEPDVIINETLRQVGEFMNADTILLIRMFETYEVIRYVWDIREADPYAQTVYPFDSDDLLYRTFIVDGSRSIIVNDMHDVQGEKLPIAPDIRAFLDAAVYEGGKFWGLLAVESRTPRVWTESDLHLAGLAGNLIVSALERWETERDLLEAKELAESMSRSKSDFLSRMSHEMRTPMNAIIGMTAIGRAAKSGEQKEYSLEKIDDASKYLLGIINDILDMAKIEAGKFELSYTDFGPAAMLANLREMLELRATEKNQKLTFTTDPNLPKFIRSDEQHLSQVVTNLVANAIKFTPDGGHIEVDVKCESENDGFVHLCFSVADTGIGISEEQQTRLFNNFEQGNNSVSRIYGGTGLGLAISKSILDLLGGEIWVESEPGNGSTFAFAFRAAIADSATVGDKITDADYTCLLGKNILLVDDVAINREIVITLLDDFGLNIDCASDGATAVNAVTSDPEKYDLLLMDIHMPGMDGDEATRHIRKLQQGTVYRVPIVAMTADVFREDVEHCLSVGMDDHIGKPIDIEELLRKLKKFLG